MSESSPLDPLRSLLGDRLTTGASIVAAHGRDESSHSPRSPDAVCFPESTAEVAAIVRACAASGTPIVPFGAGTSLEGHVLAVEGGLSVDLSRMNQIVEIHDEDLDATIEAGVTRLQLEKALRDRGLFFPVDPGADATLGGMASTRASGTTTVRYGTMRDNVLGLTVVTPTGEVVRTGGRARKSSAGYDLTRLFVGAEGTLGIITELTVRVYGLPEAISGAVVSFPDLVSAMSVVIQTIQYGIPVARIELLDEVMVGAINRYAKLEHPERPTLFLEFHGSEASVAEQARDVEQITTEADADDFRWTTDPAIRAELWEARHHAYFAALDLRPGCRVVSTDVCVPISRLADCVTATKEDIAATGVTAPLVGHAGDGNFHLLLLIDPDDTDDRARAEALHDRLVERALALGGTCTGEHGVGLGKRRFLAAEHGEPAVEMMRTIKRALDPLGIMNPGKVLPDPRPLLQQADQ